MKKIQTYDVNQSNDERISYFRKYQVCQGIHISLTISHFESAESSTTHQLAKLGDEQAFIDKIAAQNQCAPTSNHPVIFFANHAASSEKEFFNQHFASKSQSIPFAGKSHQLIHKPLRCYVIVSDGTRKGDSSNIANR